MIARARKKEEPKRSPESFFHARDAESAATIFPFTPILNVPDYTTA